MEIINMERQVVHHPLWAVVVVASEGKGMVIIKGTMVIMVIRDTEAVWEDWAAWGEV